MFLNSTPVVYLEPYKKSTMEIFCEVFDNGYGSNNSVGIII